jgi:hypothetical protein
LNRPIVYSDRRFDSSDFANYYCAADSDEDDDNDDFDD